MALIDAIDGRLVPVYGHYDEGNRWAHHVCNFNADCVRPLTFDLRDLDVELVRTLHGLLVGECAPFSICMGIYRNWQQLDESTGRVGTVVVRTTSIAVSSELLTR